MTHVNNARSLDCASMQNCTVLGFLSCADLFLVTVLETRHSGYANSRHWGALRHLAITEKVVVGFTRCALGRGRREWS